MLPHHYVIVSYIIFHLLSSYNVLPTDFPCTAATDRTHATLDPFCSLVTMLLQIPKGTESPGSIFNFEKWLSSSAASLASRLHLSRRSGSYLLVVGRSSEIILMMMVLLSFGGCSEHYPRDDALEPSLLDTRYPIPLLMQPLPLPLPFSPFL